MVSPTSKWTAKSVSNSNGVTTKNSYAFSHSYFHKEDYANGF